MSQARKIVCDRFTFFHLALGGVLFCTTAACSGEVAGDGADGAMDPAAPGGTDATMSMPLGPGVTEPGVGVPEASGPNTAPGATAPLASGPSPAATDPETGEPLPATSVPGVTSPPGNPATPGAADANAAGVMAFRHLTSREYRNTVASLLGDTSIEEDDVPNEASDPTFAYYPFRQTGIVGIVEAERVRSAAEQIATNVAPRVAEFLPCSPNSAEEEASCATEFITTFGKRAYRRPLETREVDSLNALYQRAREELALDFNGAITLLIESFLQAPAFYYHWEQDAGPSTLDPNGNVVAIGPYMLASRLSYFLWGTMPDDALMAAADNGELSTVAQVETQARRMLEEEPAREMIEDFADDLMDLDVLLARPKDSAVFPMYNLELQEAMREETREFAARALYDGAGTFTELMTGTNTSLNQPLAAVYGLDVRGNEFSDATHNAAQRGGILTLAAFLSNSATPTGSLPPRRGKLVFNRFLCYELPPPPPDIPEAPEETEGLSTRQRFEEHDLNPCATSCHTILDGLGFAFEHYDGIGAYRETDMGVTVDASSSFAFGATPTTFANAVELGAVLAAQPTAQACFTKQWLRYAMHRNEEDGDLASLEAVNATFGSSGGDVREILVALATSRTFRYRAPAAGEILQ